MRLCQRNEQEVWYALPTGMTEIVDDAGYRTGEYEVTYADPVQTWMNLSPNRGNALREPFGIETEYTKIALCGDTSCPITEDTILWIGRVPSVTENGVTTTYPHNFRVMRVAASLNYILYAIQEVDVTEVTGS